MQVPAALGSRHPLADPLRRGDGERAMAEAAALLREQTPNAVLHSLLDVALELCGGEAAGASWSHALSTLSATASLAEELGPEITAPAVLSVAGFLAHARPSRAPRAVASPGGWTGQAAFLAALRSGDLPAALGFLDAPQGERSAAWARASLLTSGGWGHHAILAGHLSRSGARWPSLGPRCLEAALRASVPLPPDEGGSGVGRDLLGSTLAALELLRRAPDLRAVHGVTYARELWELRPWLDDADLARLDAFVEGGWQRARLERRLRGAAAHFALEPLAEVPDAQLREALVELCRTEARPGFGHNLKIAEACLRLLQLLPAEHAPRVGAALLATLPAWTRSRRPWLRWRAVSGR